MTINFAYCFMAAVSTVNTQLQVLVEFIDHGPMCTFSCTKPSLSVYPVFIAW